MLAWTFGSLTEVEWNQPVRIVKLVLANCFHYMMKVLPHVAQNRSQVNTKLFRSSLELPHENEDTPVVQSNEKNTMLLFCY